MTASSASEQSSARRGALIVIEGTDRSGKSTQCSHLVELLESRGLAVELIKFPDRTTPIGQSIDRYLKGMQEIDDRVVHLMFSANRWECMSSMRRKLQQGITLIVDRYAFSGVAYSSAKGLDLQWCKNPDVGLLRPDQIIFLDIPPAEAAQRSDYGAERYEKLEFQNKVYQAFGRLRDPSWKVVDARQPLEAIKSQVGEIVLATVQTAGTTTLNDDLFGA
ncbi:deoxythymidylate kinase [Polychytrium aggregatum]|uniref:deoxythymidylate kinase n=1 Tax=Polychytrium aggregatum TaxID=110093 RepID=UPI0022FE9647|nr:deoxythymidylate kinase [Polychytrium aggregatum]KAI9208263.1 deoxythymidylate kinase [Polychytrium aggregatum]